MHETGVCGEPRSKARLEIVQEVMFLKIRFYLVIYNMFKDFRENSLKRDRTIIFNLGFVRFIEKGSNSSCLHQVQSLGPKTSLLHEGRGCAMTYALSTMERAGMPSKPVTFLELKELKYF